MGLTLQPSPKPEEKRNDAARAGSDGGVGVV